MGLLWVFPCVLSTLCLEFHLSAPVSIPSSWLNCWLSLHRGTDEQLEWGECPWAPWQPVWRMGIDPDPHQPQALPAGTTPDIQWTNLDPEQLLEELTTSLRASGAARQGTGGPGHLDRAALSAP